MWDTVQKLREILGRREKLHALLLLAMTLFMGLVESTRVASVLPFVAVLADPAIVERNVYLATAYDWLGFSSVQQFLGFLGVALFVIFVATLVLSALMQYASLRFVSGRGYVLARDLFDGYLARPYEWYLGRNSADLGKNVLSEVGQVVGGALSPAMQLVTQTAIAIGLIALLVAVDPMLAVVVTGLIGGGYWATFWSSRRYLGRLGEERYALTTERFRIAAEAFAGSKDVKVLGLESAFARRFDTAARRLRNVEITNSLIGSMPQYAMQALSFGLVLAIVLYQLYVRGGIAQALPIIAVYALAGQRLLPALQSIYGAVAKLRFAKPSIDRLYDDLIKSRQYAEAARRKRGAMRMPLEKEIGLASISYRYPGTDTPALKDVTLTIPALGIVGFVGQTGAGKTTIVDVILGLLQPQSGALTVDGKEITAENSQDWLASVGYVPQAIFLADETVAANIAFGVPAASIDMAAVERAARVANLHDFVTSELPNGYQTMIGERGLRLSGGQRQRVGIARALYRDPDLLVMDEGTSALDNITERAVMDAIQNLAQRKTIIVVAHRLSTVRSCDNIFHLERGRLIGSGPYDELVRTDERFRVMAGMAHS